MRARYMPRTIHCLLGPALVLLCIAGAGCGCGKRGETRGTADQLVHSRLMFSSDDKGRTCYLVAEVENRGELPVARAKVTATLRSASGKPRGINHCLLKDIGPGERRQFSMTVSAHDSFQRVDLTFSDPEDR